jgi:hypothetical protein
MTFSAYHDFERVKLERALQAKGYNAEKHQNDLLDAEQLIYLGDTTLSFLTCDIDFDRVKNSPQADRITIASPHELADVFKIENLLRRITGC